MKNTRTFLGISISALVIVAVFATKANTKINPYYYLNGSICVQVDRNSDCFDGGTIQCFYEDNTNYPMYSINDGGICKNPIRHFE